VVRANRAPGDQVRDVLRADRIEVFGARRHAHVPQVKQQASSESQAVIDAKAAVQPRIVDQTLPTNGRARFLEIHAHHQEQIRLQRLL